MKVSIKQQVIDLVLNHVPKDAKPVSFLMETLNLSRESVYRRLRGDIPFSVDELFLLSSIRGFSIDEIVCGMKTNRAYFDFEYAEQISMQTFIGIMKKSYLYVEKLARKGDAHVICTINHFPFFFFVQYENLFEFCCYKWLQQESEMSFNLPFSEMSVPVEFDYLRKNILSELKNIRHATLILPATIFRCLTQDIQYYNQRKLFSNDDLDILKREATEMINSMETMAKTGLFRTNSPFEIVIYISPLYVNMNTAYISYDGDMESLFWIYDKNPVIVSNPEVCAMQKKYINSIKRQSTLISLSNEIRQSEFFAKQRKFLNMGFSKDQFSI